VRRQFAEPLWFLLALVGLLFTVACASAANLLLARGVARQREIAVRLAIGASRARLIRQLFTESLVWAALAAGAAVLFAAWAGGGLVAMMASREDPIVLDVSPNWRMMLFAAALTLLTVTLCSFKERVMALLASGLGLAALTLACAGLYGLLAYAVSRQTKEIGLRLALGANQAAVLWMIVRDCLIVAALGIVVGAGAALVLGRFARNLLYQVSTTDALSLVAAGLIMLAVAAFAGFLPARRAARVDPVAALRCE